MASSSSFALDFLRRLLCAHSVGGGSSAPPAPGHLSAPEEPEGRSPCIVARLMGLDAMPDAQPQVQQPLRRTRSASSAEEGRSGLEEGSPPPPPPASLREKQAYLRAENDMFLLLSFSPEDAKKQAGGEEDAERRRGNRPGGTAGKQHGRAHRRRKLQYDDETAGRRECSAQGSSPVSVLEAREYVHEESSTTTTTSSSVEDEDTSEEAHLFAPEHQSSTTRKLLRTSFVQLDDTPPATTSTVHHASRCSDRERRSRRMANKSSDVSTPDGSSAIIWQPVCRLVEDDLKNTEWLPRHGADVVFAAEMDSEILDQLICEATIELVQLSSDDVVHALPLQKWVRQDEFVSNKHSFKARVSGYS